MEKNKRNLSAHGRTLAAFLVAPFPALALIIIYFAIVDGDVDKIFSLQFLEISLYTFLFGLPIVYGIEIALGVPVFYVLRKFGIGNVWLTIFLAAFFAGSIYLAFEIISLEPPSQNSSTSYGDSGGWIVENNARTPYGYRVLMKNTLFMMLLGSVAGLTFWKVYRFSRVK